jgi:hypothetical protein
MAAQSSLDRTIIPGGSVACGRGVHWRVFVEGFSSAIKVEQLLNLRG